VGGNGNQAAAPASDFPTLIGRTDLPERQREFVTGRWLEQLQYMEGKATQARDRYHRMRVVTIVSGVLVPALVSLYHAPGVYNQVLKFAALALGLVVAGLSGLEELFHYGERWRHFRETAESLKSEGWQFLCLVGPYRRYRSPSNAYPLFAERVEEIMQRESGQYFAKILTEQERDGQPEAGLQS
jgi:Protein of unknown function (DUF4231)